MNRKTLLLTGGGCLLFILLIVAAGIAVFSFLPLRVVTEESAVSETTSVPTLEPEARSTQEAIPTITPGAPLVIEGNGSALSPELFRQLYDRTNPGVVNVQVFVQEGLGGQGSGSGFILDEEGHIITNNHVVANAERVTVVFYNGDEAEAEIVGTDDDSDLAVLRVAVDVLPEGATPLEIGDSDQVVTGDWVIAIGNPFRLGGTLTTGVVSSVGRIIPSGVTPFSIPQAIQTDAAINPGNSGGPLISLSGEVIGVNAQIQTGGTSRANAGVGFAIPSNVVRLVAPVLIEQGAYQWPWLGVQQPADVNLLIKQANDLPTQRGVYIHEVVEGGPADRAGLQGTSGDASINGLRIPTGGDVIVEFEGEPVEDLGDLLAEIAFRSPDAEVEIVVLRDGARETLTATLEPRPQNFERQRQD